MPRKLFVGGVADVELDAVKRGEIDEIRLAELALLRGRLRRQGFLAKFVERAYRLDLERLAVLAVDLAALEDDAGRLDLRGPAALVAREDQLLAVVQAAISGT